MYYIKVPFGVIEITEVTVGKIFHKKEAKEGAVTPFQAVCTALAATVGTGNIAVVGSIFLSMKKGVSRGIFSNEAGLGTGSIAHAASDTKYLYLLRQHYVVLHSLQLLVGAYMELVVLNLYVEAVLIKYLW